MEDRRDDLRFQLRAKISQKNYVDKQMKAFHYNQDAIQNQQLLKQIQGLVLPPENQDNAEKLEDIKKQLKALKKALN